MMNFFVMNAVLIPPKHFFPIRRLLLWFAFGNIAFKEGWLDIKTWNTVERKKIQLRVAIDGWQFPLLSQSHS